MAEPDVVVSQRPIMTRVRVPKTAELIAHQLRRDIVKGNLKAGDTLHSEATLLEEYGVSRPTLREAFRILETERLITVRRGTRGGAQVTTPDLSVAARSVGLILQMDGTSIEDVYAARCVIEPACARILAEQHSEKDLDDLRECADTLMDVVSAGIDKMADPARWWMPPNRFHQLITERCGNRTLALQSALLQEIVSKHTQASVADSLESAMHGKSDKFLSNFRRTYRSYSKLIKLIEDCDGPGAESYWATHMSTAGRFLLPFDRHPRQLVDLFD